MPPKKYHHGDLKNALIQAGVEILAREGIAGLSLRKVAQQAGVSHAAPYAHFTDKQALIAAISTEGYSQLHDALEEVIVHYATQPSHQLVEAVWVYVSFALERPAHFKVTFSSAVEQEKAYPALVDMAAKSFSRVVQIVAACQAGGVLRPGPGDMLAVSVWSIVHGFASLLIEGQISHTILDSMTLRQMLVFTLNQVTLVELDPVDYPGIR